MSVDNNVSGDVVFRDKPKKNFGVILGMVFLVLLAAGGIGFGVWEMMDENKQKEQLEQQVSALKTQNSELQDKLSGFNNTENNNGNQNGDIGMHCVGDLLWRSFWYTT